VLVSGPAGVGKPRLGWEFFKYIDGLKAVVWWRWTPPTPPTSARASGYSW